MPPPEAEVFCFMKESEGNRLNLAEITVNDSAVMVDVAQGRLSPRLCYLGPEGSFSEEATLSILNHDQISASGMGLTIKEVITRVDKGEYDLGVVPVHNSTEGNVMETLRTLVKADNVTILGEGVIPIRHMLIGHTGMQIDTILSHPQALAQCTDYLSQNFPDVLQVATRSTSDAVKQLVDTKNTVAIGSRLAAEQYGVPILEENVGDEAGNATHFLLIGRGETMPSGEDTTMIVFVPEEDRPGILRLSLQVFDTHDINLTDISSHPTGKVNHHAFLVSFDGHQAEDDVKDALKLLRKKYSRSVKVLGSYKKAAVTKEVQEPSFINGVDEA